MTDYSEEFMYQSDKIEQFELERNKENKYE